MSQPAWLYAAASVSIVRHIKICSAANPFDPAWTFYLERRRAHRQVTQSHSGCWKASRMRGDSQVRFLGEAGVVTLLLYPTEGAHRRG